MEKVKLGNTGIEVSKLGYGTGTAHPSGFCSQALLDEHELAGLLIYALEQGVNFWDTAEQYGTHRHIRKALSQVRRHDVVITSKLVTSRAGETDRMFGASLKELGTDYLDVCLVHGVRTRREFFNRQGAFNVLLKHKKAGRVRAVGLSSHGMGALKTAVEIPEIDVVWARINSAGLCMDRPRMCAYDKLASVPWLKKLVKTVLPQKLSAALRPDTDVDPVSEENRREVETILDVIHSKGKGVVGMKVLAEGHLGATADAAIRYVKNLPCVDSLIVGMQSREEIIANCKSIAS